MEELILHAQTREGRGKGPARRVREAGNIPAVMYGEGENLALTLNPRQLRQLLTTEAGTNALMRLHVEGGDGTERLVMVREIQNDPIRGDILHADLLQISVDREVEVDVPIELEGVPIGVTQNEGYLGQLLSRVTVRCLPTAIPPSVNIDVSEMEVGAVIHVKDLQLPSGVEVMTDSEEAVASVTVVTVEAPEVEEDVLEGEAVEEGEEAPVEEGPEAAKEESGEG